jgi:hypothetical protein
MIKNARNCFSLLLCLRSLRIKKMLTIKSIQKYNTFLFFRKVYNLKDKIIEKNIPLDRTSEHVSV